MLDVYARLQPEAEIEALLERARTELRRKRRDEALETLCGALLHTHASEESYLRVARQLCGLFAERGRPAEALTLAWYTGDGDRQHKLLESVGPGDRARTYMLWAASDAQRAKALLCRAARELEGAGQLVRAAICYERAKEVPSARALWSRLSELLDGMNAEPYAAGLARFNLARMSRSAGDERAAREATVASVHRLEEAADRFESIGQRERAFDCYHVLIAIGELSKVFEHVLEGAVNAIRILSEDNLRYHALRTYEHSISLAEHANEYSAAATLAREMTEYARTQGLGRVAASGMLRQADLWQKVAEATVARNGPPELAENALVASLLASAEAGQYTRVGALYEKLALLELEPSRREHYARAAKRYDKARDAKLDAGQLDHRLAEHVAPPDVWHVDLVEWEQRGSASEACADVVLEPEDDSDRITRRSALLARLVALAAEDAAQNQRQAGVVLAEHLGPIGLYNMLAALERLFQSTEPDVRRACVRALGRYFYKRTFITLQRALADPDRAVVDEASRAMERLRFEHAFDPLSRIYRTTSNRDVRLAALRTLARIDAVDAAELLLGVLDHGVTEERQAALGALKEGRGSRFVDVARAALPQATPRLRSAIREVLQARGITN